MQRTHLARTGLLSAGWLALAAAAHVSAATAVVSVRDFSFSPATVTVAPGDTVRWVWVSGSHTVTSGGGCVYDGLFFDEPITSASPTFEFVVPEGFAEIPYFCRPHCIVEGMVGLIRIDPGAVDFVITLDGDQEVGPVATPASGSGTATLYPSDNTFRWEIAFSGLLAAQTAAHFHGPAVACQNAGIQITLPLGSPIIGQQVLTPTQAADVLAGRWYVNVHSTLHTGGEIRGQVMPAPLDDPIPTPVPLGDIRIRLKTIATGLTAPNWGTFAPGDTERLFVVDQDGILWAIDLATGTKSVFHDVSSRLVALGVFGPGTFDERGFLGVAFHPDYATNGLLYTYTSEPATGTPDFSTMPMGFAPNHQTVITEWHVPDPSDRGSVVDPLSARELLRIDQPQFNHNAGAMTFGPDGRLYIVLGDGGARDDKDGGPPAAGSPVVGHGCIGNGQDLNTILGSVLRIDPTGSNSANGKYGIPADNPFVGAPGLDEIYAYGFRNPFRLSFDSATGELYIPDVGQNDIEEVNIVTAGNNYGWRHKEGSFYFVFNGNQPGYVTDRPLDVPAGLVDPIAEYDHDDGIAVVGGFVYRGSRFPALVGRYVFGEFARTFSNDGRLFYLDETNTIREFRLLGLAELGLSLLGFGQDASGEIYALANATGTPFGDTGVVLQIVSGVGDLNCDGLVDFNDIDPFVVALTGQANYEAQFPDCVYLHGDTDGDGDVDFGDIDPFVVLLTQQ